ncbi:AAA family ATPase, partial [Paenibacillus abyssi]
MKIESLHIDGYGKWHNADYALNAPVVILYGPNEAGKSTLFGFIRSMLYGFATRANLPLRQEPINGGKHGGSLLLTDENGDTYRVERYAGTSAQLRVRLIGSAMETVVKENGGANPEAGFMTPWAEEITLAQADFERRFMGGIPERLFKQLFAVNLTELQEIGALKGEELGRYLYHAGWSGGRALQAAEKKLRQELDALYRPRGVNQKMNQLLKALERLEGEQRQRPDEIAAYNELSASLDRTLAELAEREAKLPLLTENLNLLLKAYEIRNIWLRKLALDRERSQISGTERLPADAESRWTQLLAERNRKEEEQQRLTKLLDHLQHELAGIVVNEALLANADEVETLALSVEAINRQRLERRDLLAEQRELQERLERLLARIAEDWTVEELKQLTITVADREYARSVKAAAAEGEREVERLLSARRNASEQAAEVQMELGRMSGQGGQRPGDAASRQAAENEEHAVFALLPSTLEELKRAWHVFEQAYREWELEAARAEQEALLLGGTSAAGQSGRRISAAALLAAAAAGGAGALALGAAAGGLRGAALWGAAAGGAALALALAAL